MTTRLTESGLRAGVSSCAGPGQQRRARCDERSSAAASALSQSAQQRSRLGGDERAHVAPRRHLIAPRVDPGLRVDRRRLVRRQRVDGEETGRMAGQPVDRHHANPPIDAVERAAAVARRAGTRAARRSRAACPGDRRPRAPSGTTAACERSSASSLRSTSSAVGGDEPRLREHRAQRVDVAARRAFVRPARLR